METIYPFFSIFVPKVNILLSFWKLRFLITTWIEKQPLSSLWALFQWFNEKNSFNLTRLVTLRVGSKKIFFFITLVEYLGNRDCACLRWSRGRRRAHLTSRFALVLPWLLVSVKCMFNVTMIEMIFVQVLYDTWTCRGEGVLYRPRPLSLSWLNDTCYMNVCDLHLYSNMF